MRILILRTMLEQPCALSVADLEDVLVTVDKSTIFRTLTMFLQHHLVHARRLGPLRLPFGHDGALPVIDARGAWRGGGQRGGIRGHESIL